ncbi:MAG: hypothetical protein GTO45_39080 [Candidatus Aminicenantes bacterium]|nr:hypothetical protein [Candidatus Aminicenantes bacterium]NIN21442.1 hypothetical protein [Candidatus Aminicenantes bacterium]NIN47857.1 hypothetical protein [Candidatus Aminicenantes bacterium]NIN90795.1 hypothetical protein [Candidatus Aminicenantes bacterium]NIO84409.1 hypothetical protein [Candidatus Aminicenantes bacterium]
MIKKGISYGVSMMKRIVIITTILFMIFFALPSCKEIIDSLDYEPMEINDGWLISTASE